MSENTQPQNQSNISPEPSTVDQATYPAAAPGMATDIARLLSNVINPVVSGVFIAGFAAAQAIKDPLQTTLWFGFTVLLTVLPPLSYILYLVKIGYLADIFMPNRQRRIKPIAFIVIWVVISALFLQLIGAPQAIGIILIMSIVLIGSLLAITFLWKVSFHTGILTTAATVTLLQGASYAWFIALLIPLVGWARVHLNRHTTLQVIGGFITGGIVGLVADVVLMQYLGI